MILAIESCYGRCSVALCKDGKIYSQLNDEHNQQSETLAAMVSEIMAEAGVNLNELKYVAVNVGIGSFSGTRVGISYAQGLAIALNIKIIPVTTFQAIAFSEELKSNEQQEYYIGCEYKKNHFAMVKFYEQQMEGEIELCEKDSAEFNKISYCCNIGESKYYPQAPSVLAYAMKHTDLAQPPEDIAPIYVA